MPWFLIPAPVTHRPSFPTTARWLGATPWLRSSMGHWPRAGRGQSLGTCHDALKMGLHSSIDMMKSWNDMQCEMTWNDLPLETSALGLPGFTCTSLKKNDVDSVWHKTIGFQNSQPWWKKSPESPNLLDGTVGFQLISRAEKTWKKQGVYSSPCGTPTRVIHQQKFLLPIFPRGNLQKSTEISDILHARLLDHQPRTESIDSCMTAACGLED